MNKIIIPMFVLLAWTTSLSAQITREQADEIVWKHIKNEVSVQPTEPVFSTKSSWIAVRTNVFDSTIFEMGTCKIDGDTLINGKNYSKLFVNGIFGGTVLRETEDNKIYAFSTYENKEILLYDFDWYPGKTLYYQTFDSEEWKIQAVLKDNIDSIQLLDGKYYQCVKDYYGNIKLIRGIGDTRGFFDHINEHPTDGSWYYLLCFYIDDILVYNDSKFNYCFFVPVTEIINVPTAAIAGIPLILSGTLVPDNATYQEIIWSVYDEGTTGAVISTTEGNYTLNTTEQGTVVVTATVNYDLYGSSYTQNFTIEVKPDVGINEPMQELSNIRVYPNPSNHSVTVEFLENLDVDIFKVFDTKGSLIKTYDVRNKNTIEVQNLAEGAYIYSAILKNNQKLSGKIIIK